MSSAPASALPLAAAPAVSDAKITARKAALAAAAGTAIEYYEFGVYGYLASTIGPMFFPGDNAAASLLAILAV
ncbi:MFS transporter, partial [Acinetobacter baumannii]